MYRPMYTPPRSDTETAIRAGITFLAIVVVLGLVYVLVGAGGHALSNYINGAVQ